MHAQRKIFQFNTLKCKQRPCLIQNTSSLYVHVAPVPEANDFKTSVNFTLKYTFYSNTKTIKCMKIHNTSNQINYTNASSVQITDKKRE